MFQDVSRTTISPRKTREQVQAQVERILALFPRTISERRRQNIVYLNRSCRRLTRLGYIRTQWSLPEPLEKRITEIYLQYSKAADAENSAGMKALVEGFAKLAGAARRISLWQALRRKSPPP